MLNRKLKEKKREHESCENANNMKKTKLLEGT